MYEPSAYFVLLILCCGYALLRGGIDARIVALLCLGGTLSTMFALSPLAERFQGVEGSMLLVDLGVLAGFVAVALQSSRFWPLWVAGLQLTASFAHALKAIDLDLLPHAYGAAVAFWSYPILFILVVATWRGRRRMMPADAPSGRTP